MDLLVSSAVGLVMAGNSGVSSFLTLFLMGCLQKYDDSLLAMDETLENILASWPSLVVLGILTLLEFIAMCVPVVDEITDTALTFIVPIVSGIATLGTFGLYNLNDNSEETGDSNRRQLGEVSDAFLTVWQCTMVIFGVGLGLTMHLFKMLVRLIGEGWLTNILTILETSWTITTVIMAIFIRQVAIVIAAGLLVAAVWHWKRKWQQHRNETTTDANEVGPASAVAIVVNEESPGDFQHAQGTNTSKTSYTQLP